MSEVGTAARSSAKKPYQAPRLMVYGNLEQLTAAKGGSKTDSLGGTTKG